MKIGIKIRLLAIISCIVMPILFFMDRIVNRQINPSFLFSWYTFFNSWDNTKIFLLFILLFGTLYYIIFKKETNNLIKWWARISGILIPIYFIFRIIKNINQPGLSVDLWVTIYVVIFTGILLLLSWPIYYFAWKKENKS